VATPYSLIKTCNFTLKIILLHVLIKRIKIKVSQVAQKAKNPYPIRVLGVPFLFSKVAHVPKKVSQMAFFGPFYR
jgi:hypothetical protein